MFENNTITISQIKNGFLVTLPYIPEEHDEEAFVRRLTRASLEEQSKDPELAKLMAEQFTLKHSQSFHAFCVNK